jgi:hypothetical protein
VIGGLCLALLGGCADNKAEVAAAEEAEKAKAAAAQSEVEATAAAEAAEVARREASFPFQMRTLGRTVQKAIQRCEDVALNSIELANVVTMSPRITADAFDQACQRVAGLYDSRKKKVWGKHYTVDSLIGKLARASDRFAIASAQMRRGVPGEALRDGIGSFKKSLVTLKRTANAVADFDLGVKPHDEVEPERVMRGKMRAYVERTATQEDRADLASLLAKFDGFAFEPAKERQPLQRASLEHFGMVYKHRLANRRAKLRSMSSKDAAYDIAFRAVAERYLDECVRLVDTYLQVGKPYRDGQSPDLKTARADRKRLKGELDSWTRANEAVPDSLAKVR